MTRLYIILLVPYVLSSRLLCYTLFCRLPNSFMVQIREQVRWALPPSLTLTHHHSPSLTLTQPRSPSLTLAHTRTHAHSRTT